MSFTIELFGHIIRDWSDVELINKIVMMLMEIHNTPVNTGIQRDTWMQKLNSMEIAV